MGDRIITWVRENIWLFSGLGTTVIAGVVSIFLQLRKRSHHTTKIKSGNNSTIINADGDVNIGSIQTEYEKKKISPRK